MYHFQGAVMEVKEKVKVIASIIKSQNGKAVTVTFTRRTDDKKTGAKAGDLRTLNGRLGVTKHLKGGSLAYNPKDYKLLTIFDLQKQGYRSIPLDAVNEVVAAGITYKF
jgi:hypothetical protein